MSITLLELLHAADSRGVVQLTWHGATITPEVLYSEGARASWWRSQLGAIPFVTERLAQLIESGALPMALWTDDAGAVSLQFNLGYVLGVPIGEAVDVPAYLATLAGLLTRCARLLCEQTKADASVMMSAVVIARPTAAFNPARVSELIQLTALRFMEADDASDALTLSVAPLLEYVQAHPMLAHFFSQLPESVTYLTLAHFTTGQLCEVAHAPAAPRVTVTPRRLIDQDAYQYGLNG